MEPQPQRPSQPISELSSSASTHSKQALKYDEPFKEDLCGTCTSCLDACPTSALDSYVLDSNKCISYLTIEHRGDIDDNFKSKLDDWIYGCDIC